MALKILYLHLTDSEKSLGGADRVVLDLARSMSQQFKEEVLGVVNSSVLARELESLSLPLIKIPRRKIGTPEMLSKIKHSLRSFTPDLVHSHHRYATFLCDVFFKRQSFVLHTEHVLRQSRKSFFRYGHLATAVSESVRENLIRTYKMPQERVIMIPNAVSLPAPEPERLKALEEKYPRAPGQVLALCVGRLAEQKGHRYLIEAVAALDPALRSRIKIFMAGEGPLEGSLKRLIQEKRLESQFVFLGFTPHVSEFLRLCDFLILPSLYEGLPLVVLEAYAAGRAVIATDIPGTREVVWKGETGSLVPPRDSKGLAAALQQWMEHPDQVREWGRHAIEEAHARFSFDAMIVRYHRLYQEIAQCPERYS